MECRKKDNCGTFWVSRPHEYLCIFWHLRNFLVLNRRVQNIKRPKVAAKKVCGGDGLGPHLRWSTRLPRPRTSTKIPFPNVPAPRTDLEKKPALETPFSTTAPPHHISYGTPSRADTRIGEGTRGGGGSRARDRCPTGGWGGRGGGLGLSHQVGAGVFKDGE